MHLRFDRFSKIIENGPFTDEANDFMVTLSPAIESIILAI
jgi:hypothetical protein